MKLYGITPAYAGQIAKCYYDHAKFGDHPRIRGTNSTILEKLGKDWGSPPHTRDKWEKQQEKYIRCRITPAYAGQMWVVAFKIVGYKDHPRIRGTNS